MMQASDFPHVNRWTRFATAMTDSSRWAVIVKAEDDHRKIVVVCECRTYEMATMVAETLNDAGQRQDMARFIREAIA